MDEVISGGQSIVHFPHRSVLWRGSILGAIVNATMTATDKLYAALGGWNKKLNAYFINGMDGTYCEIMFGDTMIVGLLYDVHSARNPHVLDRPYDPRSYFVELPPSGRALLDTALESWSVDIDGQPCVTAGFWGNEILAAGESWDAVYANGAHMLRRELQEDVEQATDEWREAYGMKPKQVDFVRNLFARRMSLTSGELSVSEDDEATLRAMAEDQEALEVSRAMFNELHIRL